jgi:hypothetical protein
MNSDEQYICVSVPKPHNNIHSHRTITIIKTAQRQKCYIPDINKTKQITCLQKLCPSQSPKTPNESDYFKKLMSEIL